MNQLRVQKLSSQLEALAIILAAIAKGEVDYAAQSLAQEICHDENFLVAMNKALGLPDLDMAVKMLAGYNPDNLYRAHIFLQKELHEE